jgi:superfamily II DNA helicase RecQ
MRLAFFHVPVLDSEDAAAALNRFLASSRILAVERHFISDGANSAWAICVTFDDTGSTAAPRSSSARRARIDYKDELTPPEFAVFARLRALRKDLSQAEGVPAYALFTDEQLAAMVRRRVISATALGGIPGVGDARVEKYGPAFLQVLQDAALPAPDAAADDDAA